MFKRSVAILIGVLMVMQSLMNLGLYTYFTLNRKMIADKLCINKNNPKLHCNGHCFLAKQLNKAEQGEKQQARSLKEQDEIVCYEHNALLKAFIPTYTVHQLYSEPVEPVTFQYQLDIVRPPAA